jgi:4-hydroxythreonine-4-phosphate dehydrogenase
VVARDVSSRSDDGGPLRIAITLGDPRGIGEEVTIKALSHLRAAGSATEFVLIGRAGSPAAEFAHQFIAVGDNQTFNAAAAGRLAAHAIEEGVRLALRHEVAALVTAPIDKSALHEAGYIYPGHTEMLAALTRTPSVAMMMSAEKTGLGGALRVVLATTHLPLARVPDAFTSVLVIEQAQLTATALKDHWGIAEPRIALCAFNPHASDNGLFGDEEQRVLEPALKSLRADGLDVSGPIPADTVFVRTLRGEFDAVIAPYHDVGMAAFKTASFGQGVNVTLGLPFPRTSPDHGTAFDITGRGLADSSSMQEAIELACRLARSHMKAVAPTR